MRMGMGMPVCGGFHWQHDGALYILILIFIFMCPMMGTGA